MINLKKTTYVIIIFFVCIVNDFYLLKNSNFLEAKSESNNISKLSSNKSNLNNNSYILGPGDTLIIEIGPLQRLSGQYTVLNDGNLSLPLIGTINVMFLTVDQAREKIKNLYGSQLLQPEIYVSLAKTRPIKVSVVGEISRPGLYNFSSTTPEKIELPTVVDALKIAGGITKNSNIKNITLTRRMPGEEEMYKRTELNILDLVINGNQNQNPYLFDGDVINVKKAKDTNIAEYKINNSNIAPEEISVTVIGKVYSPGKLVLKSNTPLNQAVLQAGGPINWKANKGNVQLVRVNDNGSVSLRKIRLNIANDASSRNNPPLEEGDIIKVNTSAIASFSEGVATVTEPISGFISAVTIFKLLQ